MDDKIKAESLPAQPRFRWIDSAKFLGMFAIYIGHSGLPGTNIREFVFLYHVPLFFMLAGFFSFSLQRHSVIENIRRKFMSLMYPYYIYAFFAILVIFIFWSEYDYTIPLLGKQTVLGIRNQLFSASLWFLPCLFVMYIFYDIFFRIAKKYSRYPAFILFTIAFVAHLAWGAYGFKQPTVLFNVDSALFYLVFFSLGAAIFPYLKNINVMKWNITQKLIGGVLTFALGVIATYLYFNGTSDLMIFFHARNDNIAGVFILFIVSLVLILLNFIVATGVCKITLLNKMGRVTLIYCGIEFIVKVIAAHVLELFDIKISPTNPVQVVIYVAAIMVISYFTIVYVITRYFPIAAGTYQPGTRPIASSNKTG